MTPLPNPPEHGCKRIYDTVDPLGHNFQVACECGWFSVRMLVLNDVVSMFGFHMMDAAYERIVPREIDGPVQLVAVDRSAVRANRWGSMLLHRSRRAPARKGPQALPYVKG